MRLEFVVASLLLTIFLLNLLIRIDIWTLPKEHSFSVQVEEHWELWSEKRKEGVFFFWTNATKAPGLECAFVSVQRHACTCVPVAPYSDWPLSALSPDGSQQ